MRGFMHVLLLLICLFPVSLAAQNKVILSGEVKEKDGYTASVGHCGYRKYDSRYLYQRPGMLFTDGNSGKQTLLVTLLGYNTIKTTTISVKTGRWILLWKKIP